jgi:cytochrome c556
MVLLIGAMVAVGVFLPGCSPEAEKPSGPKEGGQQEEVVAPPAIPEQPAARPEEPPPTPEPPGPKPAEPEAKPAEPVTKGEAPVSAAAAGLPPAPKVSTFAPAEDLANQVASYLKAFEQAVESEAEYNDSKENIVKQANTLIIIALALGMHDQENQYKSGAAALMKAAQELADARDYASAKKGVEAVKTAAAGQGSGESELRWEKAAALDQLMKQVPVVNTKLKRLVQGTRFKSKAKDTAGYAAVIATIAQGSVADIHEAKSPDQVQKWYEFCAQMRDSAGAVNAAIRAGDQPACDAAMAKLAQSCDECHKVFHPAALEKTAAEEEKEK